MPGQHWNVDSNPTVAPTQFPSAADQQIQRALINSLQQARARIFHNAQYAQSAAEYAKDLRDFNTALENVQSRLTFFSFESDHIDCCMTHVTTVNDPVASIFIP